MDGTIKFQDGSWIVEARPHPALEKVLSRGYRFEYRLDEEGEELEVRLVMTGKILGEANFTDEGRVVAPQNVRVDPVYRRQGIATALYVFAEKFWQKPLFRMWDESEQSPEAVAFWAQPHRPFGNYPR